MTLTQRPATGLFAPTMLSIAVAVLALTGCGGGKKEETSASQVAVRVNDAEITTLQLNFRLQQGGARPENADAATQRILDQLVDQELAVQKSVSLKMDKDPRVLQALDAARKEILARAYLEQITAGVPKPEETRVRQYFDEHPELFSQRRLYSLQEFAIEVPADKLPQLRERVASAKSVNDFAAWLKAENLRAGTNAAARAAEQLPMNLLGKLTSMSDGSGMVLSEGPQVRVVFRNASRLEPVTFDRAKPAIEQFLLNTARRDAVETNLKGLRTAAKVEYVGKYAAMAASQPALATTRDAQLQVNLPASGAEVALPNSGQASAAQVSLPAPGQSPAAQISLPAPGAASAAEVSLKPTTSGVEVRLDPKTGKAK